MYKHLIIKATNKPQTKKDRVKTNCGRNGVIGIKDNGLFFKISIKWRASTETQILGSLHIPRFLNVFLCPRLRYSLRIGASRYKYYLNPPPLLPLHSLFVCFHIVLLILLEQQRGLCDHRGDIIRITVGGR